MQDITSEGVSVAPTNKDFLDSFRVWRQSLFLASQSRPQTPSTVDKLILDGNYASISDSFSSYVMLSCNSPCRVTLRQHAYIQLGRSHEHTNRIEGITFYDFHIHTATERYQEAGYAEEHYAETTNRYADLNGAIQCLFQDCAFELPPGTQGSVL